jgi:uncharacterized protein
MSIQVHDDWDLSGKGKKDAARHREKIDDYIRKSIRDVIGEESIITKKDNKTVKIPVKGLKDYRFVHGIDDDKRGGIGQGEGKPGDIIGRKKIIVPGQPGAGNEEGEDYLETEVAIDYLIKIMFEDLGLPYIEEKTKVEQLVPKGWKFDTISKVGAFPRIHKKRTLKETIKRSATFASEIVEETGCEIDDAFIALAQARGEIEKAIDIVKTGKIDKSVDANLFFIDDDDLRYKQIEQDYENQSNAVVIAMMDVSGSMDAEKKYIARSFLFWMTEFLKKTYSNVKIKFIVHTTEAHEVDEDSFFKKGISGGTYCHTAFDLAQKVIETEYPVDMWNVYCVYCSDGEDFDYNRTVKSIDKLLKMKINMLGYCEIMPETYRGASGLLDRIKDKWSFKMTTEKGTNFYKNDELKFLACTIKSRDHVYPALKHLLFERKK